jgi:hypothetical protein
MADQRFEEKKAAYEKARAEEIRITHELVEARQARRKALEREEALGNALNQAQNLVVHAAVDMGYHQALRDTARTPEEIERGTEYSNPVRRAAERPFRGLGERDRFR